MLLVGRDGKSTIKKLIEVNEHKEYGEYLCHNCYMETNKSDVCEVFGKKCKTESEFDIFVKPYMEE